MSTPTFIVGTGRCGSTMLSNMLREHPKILSISEFFASLVDHGKRLTQAFSSNQIDGEHFWSFVAETDSVASFGYRHTVQCDEHLYSLGSPSALFTSETGVAAISVTTLPHLTEDYDRLFLTLQDEVMTWPLATMSEHYLRLFDRLSGDFGKQLWIERSGAALHMLDYYRAAFPDARFIHLTRDGRDVALSMQGHLGMRMHFVLSSISQSLGVNPFDSPDRTGINEVPEFLRCFLPENFDADAFRALRMPLQLCAQYWTFQVETGLNVLRLIPPDRLLTLRYENVLADPQIQLDTFAAFLGEEFVDEEWSARCAATVRQPRSTWRDLPADEACALTEACRPGFERLAEAGVEYDL